MNDGYREVIAAGAAERRNLFLTAASRMGTAVQNVEKDFWVCWTLDVLFHGLGQDIPRLLFKGGTSLSKAFALIPRFSEDIDITVFRSDLGQEVSVAELEALSGKKRRARLDSIKDACRAFVGGVFQERVSAVVQSMLGGAGVSDDSYRVRLDPQDPDGQTVLFWYPSATQTSDYVRSAVKIEAGAKSALDPNVAATVRPYVAEDLPQIDLNVADITTVTAERTFWDKSPWRQALVRAPRGAPTWRAQGLPPLLRRLPPAAVTHRSRGNLERATSARLREPCQDVLQQPRPRSRGSRSWSLRTRTDCAYVGRSPSRLRGNVRHDLRSGASV